MDIPVLDMLDMVVMDLDMEDTVLVMDVPSMVKQLIYASKSSKVILLLFSALMWGRNFVFCRRCSESRAWQYVDSVCMCVCVCVSVWDNFSASDWSEFGDQEWYTREQEWYTRSPLIGWKSPSPQSRSSQFVWWRHQASHNIARLYTHHTVVLYTWDIARRRQTTYDVARLLLMVPLEPWQNSTPFFGAAAFCTTKIGDFRTSSTLSSLTTWLRRPLRKDQLRGTAADFCTGLLARASTSNEIFQTKILAWVSTLQLSTQYKNLKKLSFWIEKYQYEMK